MREQITFAVDANGSSHYVGLSDKMKHLLSVSEAGAMIDEWPGDYPGNLKPGFYAASLDVSGDLDHPVLKWSKIEMLHAISKQTKITEVVAPVKRERKAKVKDKPEGPAELGIRVRRNGEIL